MKHSKIILHEGWQRGFLSNYSSILSAFRFLIEKEEVPPENIFLSSSNFTLYGHPQNWFEEKIILDDQFNAFYVCSNIESGYSVSIRPTIDELNNIKKYRDLIPFNQRTKNYLNNSMLNLDNSLGIHFRGTDHWHTNRIELDRYLNEASKELEKNNYNQIFISTDENNIIDKIKEYFYSNYKFDKIVFNQCQRSVGTTGTHNIQYDPYVKINMGFEVLLDAYSLSKCKTVVGKTSNLTYYARMLNNDLNMIYLDLNSEIRA